MSFDALLVHTVTIRRYIEPETGDRYNNREPAYDAELDVDTPARVEWTMGAEELQNRDLQRFRANVFLPADVVVTGRDRLYFHDEELELKVDGPPRMEYDGIGPHHLELDAYRVEG